eukprot:COSAG06_NODE_11187_length_1549_cov_0.894483_1_plen_118_part_10
MPPKAFHPGSARPYVFPAAGATAEAAGATAEAAASVAAKPHRRLLVLLLGLAGLNGHGAAAGVGLSRVDWTGLGWKSGLHYTALHDTRSVGRQGRMHAHAPFGWQWYESAAALPRCLC